MIRKSSKMLYLGKEKLRREDYLPNLEKGFAKVHGGEKVFAIKPKVEERPIRVTDKLVIIVPLDDPRSNEEIRSAWKEEQEKKLRALAS